MCHQIFLKIKPGKHPFPILLRLEWVLLLLTIIGQISPAIFYGNRHFSLVTLLFTIAFGVMGFSLPKLGKFNKIIYTIVEFVLIILAGSWAYYPSRPLVALYIILVIRSCLIFSLSGSLAVVGLALILFGLRLFLIVNQAFSKLSPWIAKLQTMGCLSNPEFIKDNLERRFNFILFTFPFLFVLALIFVLLLVKALLAERETQEKLALVNQRLRSYALRVEELATVQERNRIAREIHDSLGHSLTALNIQLETAIKLAQKNPTQAQESLLAAKHQGSEALQAVRQSVGTLRNAPFENLSLTEAIATLLQEFQTNTSINPDYQLNLNNSLSSELKMAVYRLIQEGLTNICKHAAATEVKVHLQSDSEVLSLVIEDNGKGFSVEENLTGFGIQGMKERTLALGGHLDITSTPGMGCCIKISIPYQFNEEPL